MALATFMALGGAWPPKNAGHLPLAANFRSSPAQDYQTAPRNSFFTATTLPRASSQAISGYLG